MTIIVLLILAAVTITTIFGENGLLNRAKNSSDETEMKAAEEKINIKMTAIQIDTYAKEKRMPTLKEIADNFCNDEDFESVIEKDTKTGSLLPLIANDNPSVIIVKLKEYKYQFEIDDKLQLARMDNPQVVIPRDAVSLEDIGKTKITITDVRNNKFTINVESDNPEKIATYQYYINDELVNESMENTYTAKGLTGSTNYQVEVKVVPKTIISIGKTSQVTDSAPIIEFADKFDKYIYIDSVNGNDTSGNGTSTSPYKTLDRIADSGVIEKNYSYGIILRNGEYSLTEKEYELDCNKSINIIGNTYNTILNVSGLYENRSGGSTSYTLNIYRLVWHGTKAGTNTIYTKTNTNLYNVALNMDFESSGYGYYIPGGNGVYFYNCVLPKKVSNLFRTNAGGEIKSTNCYGGFTSGYGTQNSSWDYQTNYITDTPNVNSTTYAINEEERIWKGTGTGTNLDETKANLGVYGGQYSWEFEDDIF